MKEKEPMENPFGEPISENICEGALFNKIAGINPKPWILLKRSLYHESFPANTLDLSALQQKELTGPLLSSQNIAFKVNESRCKQCGLTPHFSIYWIRYWEKVNINIIN